MAAYTLPELTIAFCTIAKPGAIPRNKPWDPSITFGSDALIPQHLEDKVFLMRAEMIGIILQEAKGLQEV